jgi:hypothetical protein
VPGRWNQALGFEDFFEKRIAGADATTAARYRAMRDRVRGELFGVLMIAMRRESPELAAAVRRSVSTPARLRQALSAVLARRPGARRK